MKRFVIRCAECDTVRKIKKDYSQDNPAFMVPLSWIKVKEDFVCSVGCAVKRYESMDNKNWFDMFMGRFFGVYYQVPGVR